MKEKSKAFFKNMHKAQQMFKEKNILCECRKAIRVGKIL